MAKSKMTAPKGLSTTILEAYQKLHTQLALLPKDKVEREILPFSSTTISVRNLVAYQIGWGTFLCRWYRDGKAKKNPAMPGAGFSSWDYPAIAAFFYEEYAYSSMEQQLTALDAIVAEIVEIARTEEDTGNLHKEGVWPWCTLANGKHWPLAKWIQINTVAPYKRATRILKQVIY